MNANREELLFLILQYKSKRTNPKFRLQRNRKEAR